MAYCRIAVVALVLLSVTVIFVSPTFHLQPSALRAMQLANLMFAILALAGAFVSPYLRLPDQSVRAAFDCGGIWALVPDLIDLNCTRLC